MVGGSFRGPTTNVILIVTASKLPNKLARPHPRPLLTHGGGDVLVFDFGCQQLLRSSNRFRGVLHQLLKHGFTMTNTRQSDPSQAAAGSPAMSDDDVRVVAERVEGRRKKFAPKVRTGCKSCRYVLSSSITVIPSHSEIDAI